VGPAFPTCAAISRLVDSPTGRDKILADRTIIGSEEADMQGDADVIAILNEVLSSELTSINQYFIHAMMCDNWRYKRLAEHSRKESIEEMRHAQEVIERILYLDGVPNMQKYMKVSVGQNVPEQHQFDLAMENDAVARMNRGIELSRTKGDNGTRALLEKMLGEEEDHVEWLEAQLQQIQDMGVQNYLAQQVGD
jgi:bacterioferritin